MPRRTESDRFWAKVAPAGALDCWLWTGTVTRNGYGHFVKRGGVNIGAHRWAYEHMIGPIPPGLDLDHLCRVRLCVSPYHLEPVTRRVNLARSDITSSAKNARKTHCPKGHPYSEANTYRYPDGRRLCRECANESSRATYWRAKSA